MKASAALTFHLPRQIGTSLFRSVGHHRLSSTAARRPRPVLASARAPLRTVSENRRSATTATTATAAPSSSDLQGDNDSGAVQSISGPSVSSRNEPHVPVLVDEILSYLPKEARTIVDCTVGAGGHAEAILSGMPSVTHYIGVDKDRHALALAHSRLKRFGDVLYHDPNAVEALASASSSASSPDVGPIPPSASRDYDARGPMQQVRRVTLLHGDFATADEVVRHVLRGQDDDGNSEVSSGVDAVLMDVGVSSMQLDDGARGFSFMRDGPLDMRMDATSGAQLTAAHIVNTSTEAQLVELLTTLGEEIPSIARRIAHAIMQARAMNGGVHRTAELADIVSSVKSGKKSGQKSYQHAATLTFQALRIAVNGELEALEQGVERAVSLLRPGGRVCIVCFHSLEDRVAKRVLKGMQQVPGGARVVTKKPVVPGKQECKRNVRCRSAKLRVAERVGGDAMGKRVKVNKYAQQARQ